PVYKMRALRNFMRDLAILPLILADECQRSVCIGKIARCVEREGSPERIAPEKPRKSRPLALARSAVSRHQPCAQVRIVDHSLQHAHARPIVSLLDLRIR